MGAMDRPSAADAGDDAPKAAAAAEQPDRGPDRIPRDLRINEPEPAPDDQPRLGADGAWEWKSHRLEPADNALADRGLERRRAAEPAITADMRTIEADLPHARLEGCPDHTLKTPDRFKEKLARDVARRPDVPATTHERDIYDGVRYTFSIDEVAYTTGVAQVHDRLTALGYDLEKQVNSWDGIGYKGINSRWVEPHSGENVEVQFHTPVSWRVNKTTHDAYEEIENPTTDPARRRDLVAWRREVVSTIPIPPGARDIPDQSKDTS